MTSKDHETCKILKLKQNTSLLRPKFESYKLKNDGEILNLYRLEINYRPSKLHLPSHAKVGYHEWRIRLNWNHLKNGIRPYYPLFISQDGTLIELCVGYDDIYSYFPDLIALTDTLILATNGAGKIYFISLLNNPAQVDIAIFSTDELKQHPFVMLDAIFHSNTKIQVLIAHLNGKETASTKSKRYSIRNIICEKNEESWELHTLNIFFSKEIPIFSLFLTKEINNQSIILGVHDRIQNNHSDEGKNVQESNNQARYVWIQTHDEINLFLLLPLTITKQNISIKFLCHQLLVSVEHEEFKYVLDSKFYDTIIPLESIWTLSQISLFPEQILEISMKKSNHGLKWQRVFENEDNALEIEKFSDRIIALKDLLSSKSKHSVSKIKSGDKYDIDNQDFDIYFLQQFKGDSCIAELSGINIIGNKFTDWENKTPSLAVRSDVDILIYDIKSSYENSLMDLIHCSTFPALSYISSSKISKKYLKYSYTGKFSIIVESGVYRKGLYNSQNAYLYWNVDNNQVTSYQSVIKLGMEALGLCQVGDHEIMLLGENDGKSTILLITDL
ncbi:hypothetical protein PCANB_001710 [Pneumocystis canis]|nr:hypothetical protein PCANB_001710 [Pneumocystis canis]